MAAEEKIAARHPSLLFIGLPFPDHSPLDPETGLPAYSSGCCFNDFSAAFMEAHNDAILAALREGRLAGMTFEDRVMTAEEAMAPFANGGGTPITFDSPIGDPSGAYRVEIAPRFGKPADTPYVFCVEVVTGRRAEAHFLGESKARVAFAHGGRTLLVRDDRFRIVRTFDLARALALQRFPDAERGW